VGTVSTTASDDVATRCRWRAFQFRLCSPVRWSGHGRESVSVTVASPPLVRSTHTVSAGCSTSGCWCTSSLPVAASNSKIFECISIVSVQFPSDSCSDTNNVEGSNPGVVCSTSDRLSPRVVEWVKGGGRRRRKKGEVEKGLEVWVVFFLFF
jgi:hypothetical protein